MLLKQRKSTSWSIHWRCSVRKGILINFAKFTGKHLCQSLFFDLLKKRLWHRCFPVNFAKFLRTPFLQNTSGLLLLYKKQSPLTFNIYWTLQIIKLNKKMKLLFLFNIYFHVNLLNIKGSSLFSFDTRRICLN